MTEDHSRHAASLTGEAERRPFHEILRSHRVFTGLTQQALADLSKISQRTIRDLEAGRVNARAQTIHLLADALQLSGLVREAFLRAGLRGPSAGPLDADTGLAVPKPVNALVGRDQEVRAMVETLGSGRSRMISICGLPGVGKTRVAAEIAAQLSAGYRWPVLWIEEGARTHARLDTSLSPLVRSLYSLIERNAADMSRVRQFMRDHDALLVLDGIADIAEPAGLEELLAYCPGMRVISTSRIPWHVAGLEPAVVSPLGTPDTGLSPDALVRVPSARLFLDRLSDVRPGFELTTANARAAAEMCRRLDGLPLALETVARHFRVLSLHQLAEVPIAGLLELALPARPGGGPETIAGLLSWSLERQDSARRVLLQTLASFDEALTAVDVARLLRRPLDEVVDDLSALIGYGLLLTSYGESATVLRIPNLLRALLLRPAGPAGRQSCR